MLKEIINITHKRINEQEHHLLVMNLSYDGYIVKSHNYDNNTINTTLVRC